MYGQQVANAISVDDGYLSIVPQSTAIAILCRKASSPVFAAALSFGSHLALHGGL